MQIDQSNVTYDIKLTEFTTARYLRVYAVDSFDITDMQYDSDGSGNWKTFNPLEIMVSGLRINLPYGFHSGENHLLQLTGEPFNGYALRIQGVNLWGIDEVQLYKNKPEIVTNTSSFSLTVEDEAVPLTQRQIINFTGAGVTATDNSGSGRTDVTIPGTAITVQNSGTALTQRSTLDFTGNLVASDDSANGRTIISGLQSYVAIQNSGTPVTQRTTLDFTGSLIATDDSANSRTIISGLDPVTIAHGGTSTNSFTAHQVVLGQGASALNTTTGGSTGLVLTYNDSSTDPSWQSSGYSNFFGDGSDGNLVIASGVTVTLTAEAYYNNVTISGGGILKPAGFRVFIAGTLTIYAGGLFHNNGSDGSPGGNGGTASGGVGGGGGAGGLGNYLQPGIAAGGGAGGASGAGGSGSNGNPGTNVAGALVGSLGGTSGGNSGQGGYDNHATRSAAKTGGSGGTVTSNVAATAGSIKNITNAVLFRCFQVTGTVVAPYYHASGGGGAGAGAGGATNSGGCQGGGGAGGGGGGTGGHMVLSVNTLAGAGTISCNGGAGGKGGNGGASIAHAPPGAPYESAGGGGGGGGSGGSGGFLVFVYHNKSAWTGTISANAGNGGAFGSGGSGAAGSGGDGDPGIAGSNGNAGTVWQFQV